MKIIFDAPFNSLSFGNVSFNLLKEMYKKNLHPIIFPHGDKVNFEAFGPLSKDFISWFENCVKNRYSSISRDVPTLKLWHLNGSERKLSDRQFLLTFHETTCVTREESTIVGLQDHTFLSSKFSQQIFDLHRVKGSYSVANIGFDSDSFFETGKKYFDNSEIVHFVLMGKFEKRKHTKKIIQLWIKKFGNNQKYRLTCCVTNPFLNQDQMNSVLMDCLAPFGGKPFNVNFVPYLKTNAEVNDLVNSAHVDLTGLSGGEGWNLPAFNATCLGKWSVVLNATAHCDWANESNSVIVNPDGQEPVHDGVFFVDGAPFNQGSFFTFNEDEAVAAMELAAKKSFSKNSNGIRLKEKFSYRNTLETILERTK